MPEGDVEKFLALARSLAPERFVARFPWDFFVVMAREGAAQTVQYTTRTGTPGMPVGSSAIRDVLSLLKTTASTSSADVIVVGRSRACDVVLADASVSKVHARIRLARGRASTIEDAGSHNGTAIGGERLEPKVPTPVRYGSAVAFGSVVGVLVDAGALRDLLLVV